MTSVLSCADVRLTAPDGRVLVEDLRLDLAVGERTALLGPSGAGKTTLLRAILDDLPTGFGRSGSIRLGGEERRSGTSAARRLVADTVAYLPQDAGASLTPTMRIGSLLREAMPEATPDRRRVLQRVLDDVLLPHDVAFLRRRPWQLSGGQQRRVALARALAQGQQLLVLDEPTAGLDPDTRRRVLTVLARLSDRLDSALLLVTHDVAAAEALRCELRYVQGPLPTPPVESRRDRGSRGATSPTLSLRDATIIDAGGKAVSRSVTLELAAGEITVLHGASGGGKTTLVRTLTGLMPMTSGVLELRGARLPGALRHRTVDQRRAIQLVRQDAHDAFHPRRTIRQSMLDARPSIAPGTLLPAVGLAGELLERRPHQLSGGQRQRLALVRALAVRPSVLLLDEPTAALDPGTADQVLATLRKVADDGVAVLIVTHDTLLGAAHADRTLTLQGGVLRPGGGPDDARDVTRHGSAVPGTR